MASLGTLAVAAARWSWWICPSEKAPSVHARPAEQRKNAVAGVSRTARGPRGMLVALGGPLREKWLYAQPRDEEMTMS